MGDSTACSSRSKKVASKKVVEDYYNNYEARLQAFRGLSNSYLASVEGDVAVYVGPEKAAYQAHSFVLCQVKQMKSHLHHNEIPIFYYVVSYRNSRMMFKICIVSIPRYLV